MIILGIQTLYDRYLVVDKTGDNPRSLRDPTIILDESSYGEFLLMRIHRKIKLSPFTTYTRAVAFVLPLLHSLIQVHPIHNCPPVILYKVDDTIESIMYRGIAENAFLSKWAGGLGGSWTSPFVERVVILRVPMVKVRE